MPEATSQDVKVEESSTSEKEPEKKVEGEEQEEQHVPYSRFQKVNQSKKELEKKLKDYEETFDRKLMDERSKIEASFLKEIGINKEDNDLDEPAVKSKVYDKKLDLLERKIQEFDQDRRQAKLDREVKDLLEVYPDADEIAIRSFKHLRPDGDLESFAKFQHEKIQKKAEDKYKNLIETKKKEAQKRIVTKDEKGTLNIPADKKPKNLREVGELVKKYWEV